MRHRKLVAGSTRCSDILHKFGHPTRTADTTDVLHHISLVSVLDELIVSLWPVDVPRSRTHCRFCSLYALSVSLLSGGLDLRSGFLSSLMRSLKQATSTGKELVDNNRGESQLPGWQASLSRDVWQYLGSKTHGTTWPAYLAVKHS